MRTIFLTVFHVSVCVLTFGQNIFNGGISSTPAMDCYLQLNPPPSPYSNIFNGGIASGYSPFCIGAIEPIPLPVEVRDFMALLKSQYVELEWITMSEIETDYFIIEKSLDGMNWVPLVEINATSSTSQENHYHTEDLELVFGLQYYRLYQCNYNGERKLFGPEAIYFEGAENDMMIFPNPCTHSMTLVFPLHLNGPFNVEISDEAGRLCASISIDKNPHMFIYDVSNLASGIYHISVTQPLRNAHLKMIKVESTNQE